MIPDRELDQRLSRITTLWSMLRQAHQGPEDAAGAARQQLMERYCGAVYRYLLGAVRDPHAAEDLTQEFALRFIRGRFRGADPARGRFRDYVKTALFHLVDDYYKQHQGRPRLLPLAEHAVDPAETSPAASDQAFADKWREELLERTWKALALAQRETSQPVYTVLRFRVENPDMPSPEMARALSPQLARHLTAGGIRQLLHRGREKFAELLRKETAESLGEATEDQVEQELADLNLLQYCRGLDRWKRKTP